MQLCSWRNYCKCRYTLQKVLCHNTYHHRYDNADESNRWYTMNNCWTSTLVHLLT